jgi:hypothetical protein
MFSCFIYRKRLLASFLVLITKSGLGQTSPTQNFSINDPLKFKKSNFSIEAVVSILPKAKITWNEDSKYHLQSSYDLGINYIRYLNQYLSISTGLHFIVGKRNFFADIPSEDINNWDGRNIIEDKELWGSLRVPLLIEKKFPDKNLNWISIKAGINLRYSGLMSDESNEQILVYPPAVRIFNAEITARNDGKPWITFLGGLSKSFLLNNKNVLSLGVQADLSPTYFLEGNYEITIPNKPVTSGTYKISGSSVGLSIQYIFTGTNK